MHRKHRSTTPVLAALSLLGLASCQAYSIHDDNGRLEGVPFYAVQPVLEQTTTFSRTWFELSVVLEEREGGQATGPWRTKGSETIAVSEASWDAHALERWKRTYELGDKSLQSVLQDLRGQTSLQVLSQAELASETRDTSFAQTPPSGVVQSLLTNRCALGTEVNYDRPLYFNVNVPAFGTANGTIELSPNGTLKTGTANVDASKLADALPFAAFVTDLLNIGEDDSSGATDSDPEALTDSPPLRRIRLASVRKGFLYTLQKVHRLLPEGDCACCTTDPLFTRRRDPLTTETADSVSRTPLPSGPKPKPNTNAFRFSGSVLPPGAK